MIAYLRITFLKQEIYLHSLLIVCWLKLKDTTINSLETLVEQLPYLILELMSKIELNFTRMKLYLEEGLLYQEDVWLATD